MECCEHDEVAVGLAELSIGFQWSAEMRRAPQWSVEATPKALGVILIAPCVAVVRSGDSPE